MSQIFATALGNVAANTGGISKLVLPSAFPPEFKKCVADAVMAANPEAFAVVVGDRPELGEVSDSTAIKYRSPEEDGTSSVVMVTSDAQAGRFKASLEMARGLLANGMPGGLSVASSAAIDIESIAGEVANLACDPDASQGDIEKLASAFLSISEFLAVAYQSAGNDRLPWPAAFMLHLDLLATRLPPALSMMQRGQPRRESLAVHLAAGLPRPDDGEKYAQRNGPKVYAGLVNERWSSSDEVVRSLAEIEEIDGPDAPISLIDWPTLPNSRANWGHPLLALAVHGSTNEQKEDWLNAWAGTSEEAFFLERDIVKIQGEMEFFVEGEGWRPVPLLFEGSEVFVLPQPEAQIDGGSLEIGKVRLTLHVADVSQELAQGLQFEIRPKSDASIDISGIQAGTDRVEIEAILQKRIGPKGSKWKERPIALTAWSGSNKPRNPFRDPVKIEFIVPNPTRPSVIGIEHGRGKQKPKARFQAPTKVLPESGTGELKHDPLPEPPTVSFENSNGKALLAVIGHEESPQWPDGEELFASGQRDWVSWFKLEPLPDDTLLLIGTYEVELTWPVIESGQVAPVSAAILGESLVPLSEALRAELMEDPRFQLEGWFREHCITSRPSDNFKDCLGTALVSAAPGGKVLDLAWSDQLGAFSNLPTGAPASFPAGIKDQPEVAAFWDAYERLRLQDLAGTSNDSALPSALDLRDLPKDSIESYLDAYLALLCAIDSRQARSSWSGYPLSAFLYNPQRGTFDGVLLSPLHPLRLAWHWSVQAEAEKLASSETFGRVAQTFLRFVDGDALPLVGPSLADGKRLLSLSLDAGPEDFLAAWHFLAAEEIQGPGNVAGIEFLGLELPRGAPSGLDKGGVASAIRDYLRVYPAGPELRVGLASQGPRERFAKTDHAVITATNELMSSASDELPGGVRVLDSQGRTGHPPDARRVLGELEPPGGNRDKEGRPPFEWLVDDGTQKVDLQFLEDTVVTLDVRDAEPGAAIPGTAGGELPINRFKSWRAREGAGHGSILATGLSTGSYAGLQSFQDALALLEELTFGGRAGTLSGELQIGQALFSDKSRWTVTGNRYLDPASLSKKLRDDGGNLALWEWRPAFLSRSQQAGARATVASTQPYTILARQTPILEQEIEGILAEAGLTGLAEQAGQMTATLGTRAIGLSSLLTMGHTQSMGAVGFAFAFRALAGWEGDCSDGEVRCVLPMDAVFPLLDTLGLGSKMVDDQRRADLLLIKAVLPSDNLTDGLSINESTRICLHPIEIKARSGSGTFPGRTSTAIQDPLEQLASSSQVIRKVAENLHAHGKDSQLLNSAFATLLEAALALKPHELRDEWLAEAKLLEAAAAGRIEVIASPGTILWFQGSATSQDGAGFEPRRGDQDRAGQVLANFKTLTECVPKGEFCASVAEVIESAMPDLLGSRSTIVGPDSSEREAVVGGLVQPESGNATNARAAEPDYRTTPTRGPATSASNSERMSATSGIDDHEAQGGAPAEQATSTLQAPLGIEIHVGDEIHGATSRPVTLKPSETNLSQMNIGVVGDLGTGKTQFLKSLIYQLSRSAEGNRGRAPKTFIFDYKKDYSTGDFPEAAGAQVLDPTRTLPINFFALPEGSRELQKVYRAKFFSDLLDKIARIGAVQEGNLYKSIMRAYKDCAPGHWPILEDILDIYLSENGGTTDTVSSTLTIMIDLQIFERNYENMHSFNEIFTKNTVLNLSDLGGAGQDIVDIVATMFLEQLYTDYMKALPKEPIIAGEDGLNRRFVDSFVLIDEAHHAMSRGFEMLMNMMLEGREFGLGVILSSQFLSHFKLGKKNWREALSTWVVHNVKGVNARDLEEIGFRGTTQQMASDLSSLEPHWAYYRCANGQTDGILIKGQPFYSLPRG